MRWPGGQHQCRQLCGHGRSWGYGMRSAAARPGPRRASRSPAAPSAGAPGTRRRARRAPQVALLVAEVRVVVGQVVEGGEVQVAHLHHPRQPVQRLHRRLALACARAPAGSAAGLGATPAGLGAASPARPAPLPAPGLGLRARAPAGSAAGLLGLGPRSRARSAPPRAPGPGLRACRQMDFNRVSARRGRRAGPGHAHAGPPRGAAAARARPARQPPAA